MKLARCVEFESSKRPYFFSDYLLRALGEQVSYRGGGSKSDRVSRSQPKWRAQLDLRRLLSDRPTDCRHIWRLLSRDRRVPRGGEIADGKRTTWPSGRLPSGH